MSLRIERVDNGYQLIDNEYDEGEFTRRWVIQEDDEDDLRAAETLLWEILEWAGAGGSKHDKERLRIVRQPGNDYGG